ncbi:RICIN domain-containing protein [Actinoplanes regularis]|uniref:Ricin-type beta-trefoil lectin domain-containing protein n=1 Tax=Actinoplanes regularis TaxID=52697 RepID=A0A239AAI3_9ACTN|nr:RICIN domain-containing protein [Actinoplanes regularis]SNR91893.1 Ricin-type beta-trefoil lectin domain-containing protein [Actinoplanes regularis]
MNDEDFGDNRDPLLVRPFIVQDDESGEHDSSGATWPAGTASDSPTQVLPVFSGTAAGEPRRARRKRRPLLLAGVGVGVVAVLAAVGYAALRPGFQPALSSDLPDHPLPAVTGPATGSPSADAGVAAGANNGDGTGSGDTGQGVGGAATRLPTAAASTTPTGSAAASPAGSVEPDPPALVPSAPTVGTGILVSGNGLCLDLPNANPVDDSVIQVFDCNRSVAQVWTLADDGTLRVMGKCALLVGDDTVHLTPCDLRTTAQWRVTGDRELVNAANSNCLTDPSDGAIPGTRVVVAKCAGRSNQHWSLS